MSVDSIHRIEVLSTFQALQQALDDLKYHIIELDFKLPCWFQPPPEMGLTPANTTLEYRKQAFALIAQLEYLNDQNPREILVGAGLIAASQPTLMSLTRLNEAKDKFKAAMLALKKAKISIQDPYFVAPFERLLKTRDSVVATSLKKMGLARLHLKQCYRRIPLFLDKPQKVSWTWANTRAITRVSVFEVKQKLMQRKMTPQITMELQKLARLSEHEPLAIVQELAPHLRANILMRNNEGKETRLMVKGPIPLVYLEKDHGVLPEFKPPSEKRARDPNRVVRSDVKLDMEVFIPSLRVHRYKTMHSV